MLGCGGHPFRKKKSKVFAQFPVHLEAEISDITIDKYHTKNLKENNYDEEALEGIETPIIHPDWTSENYTKLKNRLSETILDRNIRDIALRKIARLDCTREDLLPCKSNDSTQLYHQLSRKMDFMDEKNYISELTKSIKSIICKKDEYSEYILQGIRRSEIQTGYKPIISEIASSKEKCPVSEKPVAYFFQTPKNKTFSKVNLSCSDQK
jgi:hypothetical protein